MEIVITELDKTERRVEKFADLGLSVISRSGLHPTEINLLNQKIKKDDVKHTLFINNRTGVLPIYLAKTYGSEAINILNIDYHHQQSVEQNLKINKIKLNNLCASNYETETKLTQLFIQIDSKTYSKEFYQDIFAKHYRLTKKRGKIFISSDKRVKWFENFLKNLDISFTLEVYNKVQYIIILRKNIPIPEELNYDDTYNLELPDKPKLTFHSVPGVFAHHRIDEGAIALITTIEANKDDVVIDMGCGVGTVGIALAKYYQVKESIFVDSNIRALDCAKINTEHNKIENCSFVLSDAGLKKRKATIFVGNPPYFSNFRIADLFIDNAYSTLKRGGTAYIVAKNIKHIESAMLKVFGNVNIVSKRGYNIAISIKD